MSVTCWNSIRNTGVRLGSLNVSCVRGAVSSVLLVAYRTTPLTTHLKGARVNGGLRDHFGSCCDQQFSLECCTHIRPAAAHDAVHHQLCEGAFGRTGLWHLLLFYDTTYCMVAHVPHAFAWAN